MQLRECFARAKPFWLKKAINSQILSGFFENKKAKWSEVKRQVFTFWLQKKPNWQPLPPLYLGKWFLLRCLPCSRNTIPRSLVKAQRQRWPDCYGYILRFRSSPDFTNSVQVQPQSNLFFKCEVQVQMKTKIFEKSSLFTRKITHFFSINSRDERTVIFCDPDPVLILKTQSKSNHSPKYFSNVQSKFKWSPKYLKNAVFSQQKCRISFPLTQSKFGPGPKFWSDLQTRSNPNSTQFAIVRIQSNPTPVQCSSLINSVQVRSDSKILKWFTVWFPTKFNKICSSPGPVQRQR